VDPVDELLLIDTVKRLDEALTNALGRIADLEREAAARGEIDARRDSLDIQTAAKGGNFKHYLDPGAPADENDRLLAEEARNFINAGGVLPEGFSPRIKAMAAATESLLAGGAPPAEVK